ncbi:adenylosuccinate synthetase, partial [Candidatus Aerophobetes bacterium]|nr:adenylosuccinate synthetase [Candidatus Aerophobetes bacterium]
EEKLQINLKIYRSILGINYSKKELLEKMLEYGKKLKKYITDTSLLINTLIKEKKDILFEGAQGTLLDIDYGTYPYVTSSNCAAGGVCTGAGISPRDISKVIGVAKAYTTRVGEGPFPTELKDKTGEMLRKKGNEFGATTGRPRRCGWFDGVALRYATRINRLDELILTKLDVLDGLDKVKICVAYRYKNKILYEFPSTESQWWECEPVYEEMKGWKEDTSKASCYEDLPQAARNYIKKIEEISNVPIKLFSVGPQREEMLTKL